MAPTGSERRRLADQAQFYAPHNIQRRGSKFAFGWTKDDQDEPTDVKALVRDDVQMVEEIDVPHPEETEVPHTSEMAEVPHPFKAEALTTIKVTPKIIIEAHTTLRRQILMI